MGSATQLYKELKHLVDLLTPLEESGNLNVPGLATLNGARRALELYTMRASGLSVQEAIETGLPIKRPHYRNWIPPHFKSMRRKSGPGSQYQNQYSTKGDLMAQDWMVKLPSSLCIRKCTKCEGRGFVNGAVDQSDFRAQRCRCCGGTGE